MRSVRALAVIAVLALAGCGGGTPTPTASGGHAPITVFAAASLTGVFDEIGAAVTRDTGAEVRFEYAGSSDLAAQLAAGAPGDVFASAGEKPMADAVADGVVTGAPAVFATNTLTIVTPPADPGHVGALADLARPGVRTVVCAPQVPCGETARRLFSTTSLPVNPVSEEPKVTDVLGKVASGQADAGLVYVTDASRAAGSVRIVPTSQAAGIRNRYPIAVTRHAGEDPARAATAEAFVRLVLGDEGRATLTRAGFGVPEK